MEPFPKDMLMKAQKGAGKGYLATDSRGGVHLKWPEGAASLGSVNRVKNCVPLEVCFPRFSLRPTVANVHVVQSNACSVSQQLQLKLVGLCRRF